MNQSASPKNTDMKVIKREMDKGTLLMSYICTKVFSTKYIPTTS